ncbi:MAG TPA: hypothetical protein DIW20_01360, partial [Rhodospirillaceae bacterium]|nr:hypothetical protein [Rhodospirillaceae bacterium]
MGKAMEPKKTSRIEAFAKAAKKVVLISALALGTTGCVTTGIYSGGGQYGSPTYGQSSYNTAPRGYQITYSVPRAPWANDPSFNREVSMYHSQASSNVRLQYSRYQSRLATCNASFTRGISNNQRQIQRDRRDGTSWIEAMGTGARINQTNATYDQCRISAQATFERSYMSQQQTFDRQVETLNKKYARQYGVSW